MADAGGGTSDANRGMPEELSGRALLRRLFGLAVVIALVAGAVAALPDLGKLRTWFTHMDPLLLAVVCVLKLGSSMLNLLAFREVFCPRGRWRFSAELGLAEQATNVLVPAGGAGGLAMGAWALHQGGMPTEHISRRSVSFLVLTSIPNFACVAVLGPLLLLGVFSSHGPVATTALFSCLAWLVAVVIALLPKLVGRIDESRVTGSLSKKLHRGAVSLADGITEVGRMLRAGRWRAVVGAFGYLACDIAAIAVAFKAFGATPALATLVFGYVVGQLGGLVPLPGGVGGTEGGLIGALVLYGSPVALAGAAVLSYRFFQLAIPAIIGSIAFVRLRRTLSRSDQPALACASLAAEERRAVRQRRREPQLVEMPEHS